MKKLLMFFLLTGVFTFFVHAQQWVSFSNQKPGAPEINLLTSNAQTVSFEITIPGIYTQDTVVNGIAFTRLILSGGSAGNPVGAPEIPALRYKIAVPVCAATEIETQVVSRQSMAPCWVYPVPEVVQDKNGILVEQFSFNPNAYTQPHIPELVAAVTSEGMLRTQRFVEVIVKPVEFCPVTNVSFSPCKNRLS